MNISIQGNHCLFCQKECQNKFCASPSYCKYAFQLLKRDPKGANILSHKNSSNFHYLVGLICTDGNITYPAQNPESKNNISYACYININTKDEKILKDIVDIYGGKISRIKDGTTRWSLSNKFFIDYLKECGLTHNKSLHMGIDHYFNSLIYDYKIAFLRGVIDGDGSIKKFNGSGRMLIFCSGDQLFLKTIQKFIKAEFNIDRSIEYRPQCRAYYLLYNGRFAKPILTEIYKSSGLKLERKYNVYVEHFKNWTPRW